MQAGHSIHHHVERIPVANYRPAEKQGKNKLHASLHNILDLGENAPERR